MADVPISDALIDSAQFQIQTAEPATTGPGNVRLFRGEEGWAEKREDGSVGAVSAVLHKVSVRLTRGDLLVLHTTPKVVLSRLEGKRLVPVFIYVIYAAGATAYTSSGAPSLYLQSETGARWWFATWDALGLDTADSQEGMDYIQIRFGNVTADTLETSLHLVSSPLAPLEGGDGEVIFTLFYLVV